MEGFCRGPSYKKTCDHDDMVTRYAGAGRVQTTKILSQNRDFIILGRSPINKTQKMTTLDLFLVFFSKSPILYTFST
jgi:hypothetical protein